MSADELLGHVLGDPQLALEPNTARSASDQLDRSTLGLRVAGGLLEAGRLFWRTGIGCGAPPARGVDDVQWLSRVGLRLEASARRFAGNRRRASCLVLPGEQV